MKTAGRLTVIIAVALLMAGVTARAQGGRMRFHGGNDTLRGRMMQMQRDSAKFGDMQFRHGQMAMAGRGMRGPNGFGGGFGPGAGMQFRGAGPGPFGQAHPGFHQPGFRQQGFGRGFNGPMFREFHGTRGPLAGSGGQNPFQNYTGNIPGLTDKQKQQISDLRKKQMEDVQKIREESFNKIKAVRDANHKKILDLLTDEQKKAFEPEVKTVKK
ncbi:MAG: hypothetical protein U0X39_01405 [Bacteroidales bacterium]